jgi:hypothetical protein
VDAEAGAAEGSDGVAAEAAGDSAEVEASGAFGARVRAAWCVGAGFGDSVVGGVMPKWGRAWWRRAKASGVMVPAWRTVAGIRWCDG